MVESGGVCKLVRTAYGGGRGKRWAVILGGQTMPMHVPRHIGEHEAAGMSTMPSRTLPELAVEWDNIFVETPSQFA